MKSRRILAVLPLVTLASAEQHYVRDQTSYDLNLTQLSQPCTEHFLTIGDTCGSLAAQYNVSVLDLDAFNKFTFGWRGCEQLVPGRAICLSPGAPPKTLPKEGAECGPEASGRECPLGACCSIDGKCGTTEEYCAAEECISDCFMPVIPATCDGSQISRKIGFYTGSKPVGDLNLTGYTHVIAASADLASDTITFKNAALTELPNSIRAHSSGVKALVSVVNWEERIRSSQGRASVLQNLLSLVTEHGWDGFDLAVNERYEGTDRIQLGDFIKELRRATGYQMIISASLPTAYDELRKCDIRGMNSQVSFVNMKSYALLDSSEALQLYMRAGLTLDKINVGVNDKIDRLLPFAQHSCVGGVNAWAVESLDMKVQAALHSLLTPVVDHSSSFNEAALSCFGDPAICDLPLPWIAFQGQHNAGAASLKGRNIFVDIWNSCHRATRRSYAGLLDDGVRWFNVDTCKDTGKGEVVNCHTDLAVGERMEDSLLQIFNWLKDMPNGEFAVVSSFVGST
ncbi:glycoside hydrolase superfamily [Gaertneriomyces semiglobifer]|nr:glycoside hydrolase superfamily [Gaertneriomyces semiglobifer]